MLLKILPLTGITTIWNFYHRLCSKVTVQHEKKTSTTGMHKFVSSSMKEIKTFTYIYKPYLMTMNELEHPTIVIWKELL